MFRLPGNGMLDRAAAVDEGYAVFASSTESPSAVAAWLSRMSKEEKAIRASEETCRQ